MHVIETGSYTSNGRLKFNLAESEKDHDTKQLFNFGIGYRGRDSFVRPPGTEESPGKCD